MQKKTILLFLVSMLFVSCSNNGRNNFTAFPGLEYWINKNVISNAAKMRKEYAENGGRGQTSLIAFIFNEIYIWQGSYMKKKSKKYKSCLCGLTLDT